jgi:hypothetical protein
MEIVDVENMDGQLDISHGRERSIRALVDVSVVVGILTGVLTTGSVLRMARVRAMVVVFVLPATDLSLDVLQRILRE